MRVLVADDHPLYLEAAQVSLERHFQGVEIALTRTLPEALARIESDSHFDLLLLDFSMPGMDGVAGVRAAVALAGSAPVVVMSGVADRHDVGCCVEAGAKGFLPKTLEPNMFAAAIGMILMGGTYVPAEFAGGAPARERPGDNDPRDLSARELEVLTMMADGRSNKEIANRLEIQEVTVKLHATRIFTKLGVKNRSQAAVKALEDHLVRR